MMWLEVRVGLTRSATTHSQCHWWLWVCAQAVTPEHLLDAHVATRAPGVPDAAVHL